MGTKAKYLGLTLDGKLLWKIKIYIIKIAKGKLQFLCILRAAEKKVGFSQEKRTYREKAE